MYIYICIYIYICMYIYVITYVQYIYICVYILCIYICVCVSIYIYTWSHIYIYDNISPIQGTMFFDLTLSLPMIKRWYNIDWMMIFYYINWYSQYTPNIGEICFLELWLTMLIWLHCWEYSLVMTPDIIYSISHGKQAVYIDDGNLWKSIMRMEDIRDIHFLEYQDLQILWDQENHMNHQVVGRKSWAMSQDVRIILIFHTRWCPIVS